MKKGQAEWVEAVKDRLSRAILAKGLSQRRLAERLGVTGSAIAQRMGREGSLKEWWALYRMAQELGISADELLGLQPGTPPVLANSRALRRLIKHLDAVAVDAKRVAVLLPDDD